MADEDTPNTPPKGNQPKSLIDQARDALEKASKEGALNKIKDIMKKRREAEKVIALCDLEAAKVIDDFEKGLL